MKKQYLIYIAITVVVLALVYFFLLRRRSPRAKPYSSGGSDDGNNTPSSGVDSIKVYPLRRGSGFSGNEHVQYLVRKLQQWINENRSVPLASISVDGYFGEETEKALESITGKTTMSEDEFNEKVESKGFLSFEIF